jgi:RNA polymerase sigma-70 factor, ECF subfamily
VTLRPEKKSDSSRAADLIAQIQAGDVRAEEELVHRYRRGILMILSRSPESRHAAEDLCQDTLRIAIESIRSGHIIDPERLSGFVCGIARNLVLNYSRRTTNREISTDDAKLASMSPGTPPPQLDNLLRAEQNRVVRRVIDELPADRDRELLYRFYIAEEEKESICNDLGLSSLHFNRVLFRARERYRQLYEKYLRRK